MNELTLNSVRWESFQLGDLFEIENCKCSKVSGIQKGNIPYIGATNNNNGVMKFIGHQHNLISKGNCIVFVCDGEGSIGLSIYKKEDFIGTTTVKIGRNININRYTGVFITTIADKVRGKYNFGYKRNEKNLKRERLMLPIDSLGNPNWQFMEDYMTKKEKYLINSLKDKFERQVLANPIKIKSSAQQNWNQFFLEDIATIESGERLTKSDMDCGLTPFIGASEYNNGITNFINLVNKSLDKNLIGVNYNGSVGFSFYHPYTALFSDDVKRVKWKEVSFNNKYTLLYLSNAIMQQKAKYAYGYKFNAQRMKRQKIMLPVNSSNQPDFEYMSNYMKKIESEKIKDYFQKKKLSN